MAMYQSLKAMCSNATWLSEEERVEVDRADAGRRGEGDASSKGAEGGSGD